MGGDDYRRTYVRWPQEACFIGPDRHRVRYDELSHPQWAAGISSIAANEPDFKVQRNMFQYIAAIQQDVVDFGLLPARGAHAVVLIAIEEGRALWADLESVQSIRINYSSKARAQTSNNAAGYVSNVKARQGIV